MAEVQPPSQPNPEPEIAGEDEERNRRLEEFRDLLRERRRRKRDSPLEFYEPLPHQARFHASKARERVIIAGNRAGKTEANVVECIRCAIGMNPHRPDMPVPNIGWVISVSNEAQRDILQPKFLKYLPKSLIAATRPRGHGVWDQIVFTNGSVIGFKSAEQDRKVFQGVALHWASFDEETLKDIYDEVKMRLADYAGDTWTSLTPINGMSWGFDQWIDPDTRVKDLCVVTASMWDNARSVGGYIDDAEIRRIEDEIGDPIMKRIRIYGEYHSQAGRIYKMFDRSIHGVKELPRHLLSEDGKIAPSFDVYCGIDTGRCFGAAFILIDYFGNAWLFDEYYAEGAPIAENARAILGLCSTYGISPEYVIDPTTQFAVDLAEFNIVASQGDNEVMKGIEAVQGYMNYDPAKSLGWQYKNPMFRVVMPRCPRFLKEVQRYQWEPPSKTGNAPGELKNAPRKKDDHVLDPCFVAGTMVATDRGPVQIEKVSVGDFALTRNGYRRVVESGMTRAVADTRVVLLSNGTLLNGTADHPIWVEGWGWKPLHALRYGDIVLSCGKEWKSSYGKESSFGVTRIRNAERIASTSLLENATGSTASRGYTKRYGASITGLSRKDSISTIETDTLSTTNHRISNPSQLVNTSRATGPMREDSGLLYTPLESVLSARHGTDPRRDCFGIASTHETSGRRSEDESLMGLPASIAVASTQLKFSKRRVGNGSVPTTAKAPGAELPASTTRTESVPCARKNFASTGTPKSRLVRVSVLSNSFGEPAPVYNLSVSDVPEFFANGILVHNCRYILVSHPEPSRPEGDDEDKRPMVDRIRERVKEQVKNRGTDHENATQDQWGLEDY